MANREKVQRFDEAIGVNKRIEIWKECRVCVLYYDKKDERVRRKGFIQSFPQFHFREGKSWSELETDCALANIKRI